MFTGLIEQVGEVTLRDGAVLAVSSKLAKPRLGASVSINGCCLTVVSAQGTVLRFDVGPETYARTNLGRLDKGHKVNVEPSLKLGDEVGGHFVTGHVDATGKVLALKPWGKDFYLLRVELPKELKGMIAEKGSVSVDGVSLTVAKVERASFDAMIVPHTLANTTLGTRKPGDLVNLEADPFARYAFAAVRSPR